MAQYGELYYSTRAVTLNLSQGYSIKAMRLRGILMCEMINSGCFVSARKALQMLDELRGLGKVDREVHCYEDGYQLDIHEMFVSR